MSSDVLVVGAGAIGTLIAYAVYTSTGSVDIVVRDESRLTELSNRGCRISLLGREETFQPRVYSWESLEMSYRVVFICSKAYDVPNFIDDLGRIVDSSTVLVSIQNGIGTLELLKKSFPDNDVYGAVISYGAVKKGLCDSLVTGIGNIILESGDVSDYIKSLLSPTLNVEVVDHIDGFRWLKTLVNAGINPVTVLFNERNRVILENRWARELAVMAVEEGSKVVQSLGIELPSDPVDTMLEIAGKTRDNYSSMLQDVMRGSETEIDYINGAIVKYGEKLKISTPINRFLVLAVRGLSEWRRSRSGPSSI